MKQIVTLLCLSWIFCLGSLYGQSGVVIMAGTGSITGKVIESTIIQNEDITSEGDSSSNLESSILDGIDKSTILSNPYPNPARSYTQIDYELPGELEGIEIKVLSLIGNEVVSKEVSDLKGTIRIDTDQLNSGVYFIYLKNAEKFITSRKLVVSN